MAPGQPARAPIPPSLAVCAGWPFCFHALTDWFLRCRSIPWAILSLCRSMVLKQGALQRLTAQKLELFVALTLAVWQPARIALVVSA